VVLVRSLERCHSWENRRNTFRLVPCIEECRLSATTFSTCITGITHEARGCWYPTGGGEEKEKLSADNIWGSVKGEEKTEENVKENDEGRKIKGKLKFKKSKNKAKRVRVE
jgi:hypothetical protein